MKRNPITRLGLCTLLGVLACSKDHAGDRQGAARTASGAAAGEKPAPFDAGPVKIALVQYSGAGDYFEQWTAGARKQGDAAGFDIQIYDAHADSAKQASDMDAAIASGVKGIIVDHGLARPMCPPVRKATDAGIAVVVYGIEITPCAPKAVHTAQDDANLATLVLTQMAKDVGDGAQVGYVTVFGIDPFDRPDVVWRKFRTEHKWEQKFVIGKLTNAMAPDNAPLVAGVLKANPQVKTIFASYDELTKATLTAVEQNNLSLKVAVYGIDISNDDIELMTEKDSPWKATATTDPKAVGAAVTRTLVLELAGKLGKKKVVFPGALVTQAFLLENRIKNMDDLRAKLPQLNLAKVSSASWLRSVSF
jgi:simple sugar transport system substrate-binding protein